MQASWEHVAVLARADHGLAVVATSREDRSIATSVVNAAVTVDPLDGSTIVAFVARGRTAKLANLRTRPSTTVVFRVGWEWAAIEGEAELHGPDDLSPRLQSVEVRQLLRDIFHAAGGVHEDLDRYDRVMAEERRTAVLVHPTRVYTNPVAARHIDHDT